ncbi:hypothetical protein GGP46_000050 [Salinibacter ruber]|nr:hypothetical protein [Salinibacter ruber]
MVTTIFRKMAETYNCQVGFWQRQFLQGLFKAVLALRGPDQLHEFGPLQPIP